MGNIPLDSYRELEQEVGRLIQLNSDLLEALKELLEFIEALPPTVTWAGEGREDFAAKARATIERAKEKK
ncbi:MAG: hypothetical protein ACRDH9_09280 [Actinomycetota bacterium]